MRELPAQALNIHRQYELGDIDDIPLWVILLGSQQFNHPHHCNIAFQLMAMFK